MHTCMMIHNVYYTCIMHNIHHGYTHHGYKHRGCMHHGYVHPGYIHPRYMHHGCKDTCIIDIDVDKEVLVLVI